MKTLILWLALVSLVIAGPPPKAVPIEVTGDTVVAVKSFPCQVTAKAGAGYYVWTVPAGVTYTKSFNVLNVTNAPPGSYKITVEAISGKVADDKVTVIFTADSGETTLIIGGTPTPPVPPVPPTPPVPPVPVGAMRVLIVYETADLPKLTKEQRNVIYDPKVRGALKDRTDKNGPDGRGWNIFDKDTDVTAMDKFWQDSMKRARASVPFIHIWKGDTIAFEGPLPATSEETINLITKYAS